MQSLGCSTVRVLDKHAQPHSLEIYFIHCKSPLFQPSAYAWTGNPNLILQKHLYSQMFTTLQVHLLPKWSWNIFALVIPRLLPKASQSPVMLPHLLMYSFIHSPSLIHLWIIMESIIYLAPEICWYCVKNQIRPVDKTDPGSFPSREVCFRDNYWFPPKCVDVYNRQQVCC